MQDNLITVKPSTLRVVTIKDFVTNQGFEQIKPHIGVSTEGVPFIVFIDGMNKSQCLFFSRSASKLVTKGQPITKELLSNLYVGLNCICEKAESGFAAKIITNSERVEISSLLD